MSDPLDDFVGEGFHGLISSLQENDLKAFENQRQEEREKLNAVRAANNQGMNISELASSAVEAKKAREQLDASLDKMQQDAADAAAKKEADAKQELPVDRFPAPITTV